MDKFDTLCAIVSGLIKMHKPDEKPEEEDYDDTESAYNNGAEVASWQICAELEAALRKVRG